MNYRLVPDLVAMATLLALLYFLRKRHAQKRVDLWVSGLLFIFLEAVAHAFYPPKGLWHVISHIIALDAYFIAGVIFLWAAAKPLFPRPATLCFLFFNALAIVAVLTTYGLDVKNTHTFQILSILGLVLSLAGSLTISSVWKLHHVWRLLPVQFALWGALWFFASHAMYRDAAYFPLFVLYLAIAVVFQFSLSHASLGRLAIVVGFTIWSLVFFFHSWVANHPQYTDIAAQVWDMQKFLVTIGMLLVLLEDQVVSNERYALQDYLTGLPNRRLFEDRLHTAILHAQRTHTRVALLMLDLDGFKLINDTYGHDAGDELLKHVSVNLRSVIRVEDTLARLGGDEFSIIVADLPYTQPDAEPVELLTQRTIDRIMIALRSPFNLNGNALAATGSIGFAIYPDDTNDEVLLRRLADQRMYQQKRQLPLRS